MTNISNQATASNNDFVVGQKVVFITGEDARIFNITFIWDTLYSVESKQKYKDIWGYRYPKKDFRLATEAEIQAGERLISRCSEFPNNSDFLIGDTVVLTEVCRNFHSDDLFEIECKSTNTLWVIRSKNHLILAANNEIRIATIYEIKARKRLTPDVAKHLKAATKAQKEVS